jgi:hypothetical protein
MEEVKDSGWNGHKWRDANPRQLQVGAGTLVLYQHCVQCGRDFLMDLTSRRSRAVAISAVSFHQLDDAVTERWLRESCPGTHLLGDEEDRGNKIAELLVFDEPLVGSKQEHR